MIFQNYSERFDQQILSLLQAHRTGNHRSSEIQHALNDMHGKAAIAGEKIKNLKDTFLRSAGKDYDSALRATDQWTVDAVKIFHEKYETVLREAESERTRQLAGIDLMNADLQQTQAWLTPTGILVNSFLDYFKRERPEELVPGRIFVTARGLPDVPTGDPRRKKLDRIQDQIITLSAQQDSLQNASVSADLFKQRLTTMLEGSTLGFAVKSLFNHQDFAFSTHAPLTLKDMAIILGTGPLVDRLYEISKGHQEIFPPVDVQERRTRLNDFDQKMRSLALAEELEVLALFDAGIFCTRRETADPAVLVDVWNSEGE